jgi:hypothetical protein
MLTSSQREWSVAKAEDKHCMGYHQLALLGTHCLRKNILLAKVGPALF